MAVIDLDFLQMMYHFFFFLFSTMPLLPVSGAIVW